MGIRNAIRRRLYGKNVFALHRVRREFPPVAIRPYGSDDLEGCREIYQLNDEGRFPPDHLAPFEENLTDPETLSVVLEADGIIVGTGGVSVSEYSDELDIAIISYGMIHPAHQGKGLGVLLLAFRLSLLDPLRYAWSVLMTSAGNGTAAFFEKMGFIYDSRRADEAGLFLDDYQMVLPGDDIEAIRKHLMKSQAVIDDDANFLVPKKDQRADYQKLLADKRATGKGLR